MGKTVSMTTGKCDDEQPFRIENHELYKYLGIQNFGNAIQGQKGLCYVIQNIKDR